jgi:hypothetical protein
VLCKPCHAEPLLASRILAVLTLQEDHPLIHPIVIPTVPTPACAFFLPNGYWSDQRNVQFPEHVKAEDERIATVIREEHSGYVTNMAAALAGKRPHGWSSLPLGLGFTDPDDECSVAPPLPSVLVDEEALGEWGTPEFFGQLVGLDYKRERYLAGLTGENLNQRAADAVLNAYDYVGESQLIVDPNSQGHVEALARLGEVMEELRLRHGRVPDGWYQDIANQWGLKAGSKTTARALAWIQAHQGLHTDGVVKYGKLVHLRDALEHGRFLVKPASMYAGDPSLNRAQAADELTITYDVDVKRTRFEILNEEGTQEAGNLSPIRAVVTKRSPTDVYVFCTSRLISARLFHDFESNGCLLVRDRETFLKRLAGATNLALSGWEMLAFDVGYFDAFARTAADAQPLFSKPVKYRYQHEHRVVWLPPSPRFDLPPIWVEIGCLADIAEIINVEDDD